MSRDNQPLILGLPGTGNNMIADLIGGAIHHYSAGLSRVDLDVPIVIPVRDRELHWYRSTGRMDGAIEQRRAGQVPDVKKFTSPAELHHAHWWPTLNAIAGRSVLVVRYEDITADPEKWRLVLCEHASVDPQTHDWSRRVTDENAKWRKQMAQLTGRDPERPVRR